MRARVGRGGRAAVAERVRYAPPFAPTTGDRIHLADTSLTVEVTEDLCRPRGGEERAARVPAARARADGTADTVVTGAVILDHWGVVKADVGIRDGRICGIGKAGDPDTTDGVHPGLAIGPSTDLVEGDGLVLTAGAVDCHAVLDSPARLTEALAAGVTTVVGTSPGAWHLTRLLEALDATALNVALLGLFSGSCEEAAWEHLRAGAAGLAVAGAAETALRVADAAGVRVAVGGDAPGPAHVYLDACSVVLAGRADVLPSSVNPTRPYTVNTPAGGRAAALAAQDLLHDLGAISMCGSGGRGAGHIGETVLRTWQTAHVNRVRRGPLAGDGSADNLRARRYVAKYTICPAVAYGLDDEVGSVAVGKLADLVLWEPEFFGVRPRAVLKGGTVAHASPPGRQPVLPGPGFGASSAVSTSLFFVAPAALDDGLAQRLDVRRRLAAVADVRGRAKASMPLNDALPGIEVDPGTAAVRIDGERVEEAPAGTLPMAQRYFLF